MTDIIDSFELPYPNWYDPNTGRIYKDVLIKNFNAIEEKINEIESINLDSITKPDLSQVVYPDVDLTDEDDQILNLRSFLTLTDLINFPVVVKTDGNRKVNRVEYWGSDYHYHTITTPATATEENPFVYLDYTNNELVIEDTATTPEGCVLVAILSGDQLITNKAFTVGNADFINILCNQSYGTPVNYSKDLGKVGYKEGNSDNNTAKSIELHYEGQSTGHLWGEKDNANSSGTYGITYNTYGLNGGLKE